MGFISPIPTDSRGNEIQTGSLQELGRDDFLQLLITKLRYQDPLKPVTDEDFVAQLAQFSTLEQMNQISEGIVTSNQWDFLQMQSVNNMLAANLIGKEVKAAFEGIYVQSEGDTTINFTNSEFAEQMRFVVKNASGDTVTTFSRDAVAAGSGSVSWDGRDDLGNRVAEGFYTIEVTATTADGEVFEPSMSLVGIVQTIIYRDGGAYLRVNGTEIALGDITAVGEPGSFSGEDNNDNELPE